MEGGIAFTNVYADISRQCSVGVHPVNTYGDSKGMHTVT